MNKILVILFAFIAQIGFSQTKITWKTLNDVTFTDKYSEEVDAYYYYQVLYLQIYFFYFALF